MWQNLKTLFSFSLKKYLFSWLYRQTERERKKPVIIWQTCRQSRLEITDRRVPVEGSTVHLTILTWTCVAFVLARIRYVKQLFYEGVRIRACIICWHEVRAKNKDRNTECFQPSRLFSLIYLSLRLFCLSCFPTRKKQNTHHQHFIKFDLIPSLKNTIILIKATTH